ncbi:MAG: ATP-grasp domain-containing protein [Planctomycetota bacterium]
MEGAKSVLLLGNHRQSLALARALGAAGWRVVMGYNGGYDNNHGAHRSNWVAEVWRHPDYAADGEAFDRALRQTVREREGLAAVFPVNDAAMRRVGPMREELGKRVAVVMANASAVTACLDKDATVAVCERLGLAYPRSRVAEGLEGEGGLRAVVGAVGLPCVVKPLDAAELIYGVKAAIVRDAGELTTLLGNSEMADRRVLVQRFVDRPRHSVHLAAKDGRLIAAVDALALRTDRADGTGFAVSAQTIEPAVPLREATERLVAALDYTGVGCLQFLMEPGGDEPTFLEFNARVAGSFYVAEAAGVPLSEMALALGLGQTPAWDEGGGGAWAYKRGVRFAWTCGALAGVRFERRRGVIGLGGAIGWLGRTVGEAVRADCHIGWRWRDPLPTLVELTRPLHRGRRLVSGEASGGEGASAAAATV